LPPAPAAGGNADFALARYLRGASVLDDVEPGSWVNPIKVVSQTGIDPGDTTACLTGKTFAGVIIEGCDSVKTR
jgi:hypothetical protein